MIKSGFFGGTFDPIHLGHLRLAQEVLRKGGLDEVLFCPARRNPFKAEQRGASVEHRLKMVELAIADFPKFRLLDIEAKEKAPSYTIDTLRKLLKESRKRQIYLIISDELVKDFFKWKEAREIVKMVPLLVGSRLGKLALPNSKDPEITEAIKKGVVSTSFLDISATEIRQRIKEGRSIDDLVPPRVADYIKRFHLYS